MSVWSNVTYERNRRLLAEAEGVGEKCKSIMVDMLIGMKTVEKQGQKQMVKWCMTGERVSDIWQYRRSGEWGCIYLEWTRAGKKCIILNFEKKHWKWDTDHLIPFSIFLSL